MSDNDNSPAPLKPSPMKARGGVPLPGFKPPIAGLKPALAGGGGGGGGMPAGLAEMLAKRRQQQKESEEENNNDSSKGVGIDENVLEIPRNGSSTASSDAPQPPSRPSRLPRRSRGEGGEGGVEASENSSLRNGKSESEGKTGRSDDVLQVPRKASTAKSNRISNIGAGLNFNPLMLRPPSSGPPTSPPSSGSSSSSSHPKSPPFSNPGSPPAPPTPLSPAPVPIDLNAPPPTQHTKSLLANDAIKNRARISAQRKPPSRQGRRKGDSQRLSLPSSPLDQSEKKSIGGTKSLPPTFNGMDLTIEERVSANNNETKDDDDDAADTVGDSADTAGDSADTNEPSAAANETTPKDATSDATAIDGIEIASEAKQEVADIEEVKLEIDESDSAAPQADDQEERASHSSTPSSMSTSPLPPPLPTSSPPPLD